MDIGRSRIRNGAAGIVALLGILAIAGGCGGSSDGPSEAALRKKLATAAQKLTAAKSFRATVLLEAAEDGVAETLGCIAFAVDKHGKPERVEVAFFEEECSEGSEAHKLIAVGGSTWVSSKHQPDAWREGTIAPALLRGLDDERTDLGGLIAAAEDIGESSESATVEEEPGIYADVPTFEFKAPASAFPTTASDLQDIDLDFTVVVDRQGVLRELVLLGGAEGAVAGVIQKYTGIDQPLAIFPPDPSLVHGRGTTIRSQDDLDRLFGSTLP